MDDVGNIKKCKALTLKDPSRAHAWQMQADRLVELKRQNPSVRIQTPDQLGPRTCFGKQFILFSHTI